jgi:hypothetical protein
MKQDKISKGKVLLVCNSPTPAQKGMRMAIKSLGWDLHIFCWNDFIQTPLDKIQTKYILGPLIKFMNNALVKKCSILEPEVVLVWKGILISFEAIKCIKKYSDIIVSNNADNPFGEYNLRYAKKYKTVKNIIFNKIMHYEKAFFLNRQSTRFIRNIPLYDIHFVPRLENIKEYQDAGAKEVELLYRYFTPEFHYPVNLTSQDIKEYGSDVIFIGHYEPDHRSECLEALVDANIHVRLFGAGWDYYLTKKLKKAFGPAIKPLYGDEYIRALCASKMALCFMSKLNKDTSTTRCFEIPACGVLLLSERTNELKSLYEEEKEAVYFSDKTELVEKVKMLLNQPEKRKAISTAGHRRCLLSKCDVYSRMRTWDNVICRKLNINKEK